MNRQRIIGILWQAQEGTTHDLFESWKATRSREKSAGELADPVFWDPCEGIWALNRFERTTLIAFWILVVMIVVTLVTIHLTIGHSIKPSLWVWYTLTFSNIRAWMFYKNTKKTRVGWAEEFAEFHGKFLAKFFGGSPTEWRSTSPALRRDIVNRKLLELCWDCVFVQTEPAETQRMDEEFKQALKLGKQAELATDRGNYIETVSGHSGHEYKPGLAFAKLTAILERGRPVPA